jgi:hypothetical protein
VQIQIGYTSVDIASGLQSKVSRELIKLLLQDGFNLGKKNRWGEDYQAWSPELIQGDHLMMKCNSWSEYTHPPAFLLDI